jgi:hypothetical protein
MVRLLILAGLPPRLLDRVLRDAAGDLAIGSDVQHGRARPGDGIA